RTRATGRLENSMMFSRSRRARSGRRILVLPAVLVVLAAAATATHAYFNTTGSGAGNGATGTLQPVTVAAFSGGDAPSTALLPGASADVILRVNNPNAYAVRLVGISGNGAITAASGTGACATTGVTFTAPSSPNFAINASATTLIHLAGAAAMATD